MRTHISARLAWHDSGWNGCVCINPKQNVSCLVHEHIRDSRDDEFENKNAGKRFKEIKIDNLPPCSRDPASFSEFGFRVIHNDPLDWRALPPTEEDIPAYSFCTSPYGRMFRDDGEGWENDPDKQLDRLKNFWSLIEPNKSLVFFYLNHGNPLKEEKDRILVGIGRIFRLGPQLFFGKKKDVDKDNPVWSKCVTHNFPEEGIRLPYQEYLNREIDPSGIICTIPDPARPAFRYVCEHVSDDVAVGIIERTIHVVRKVIADGKVQEPYGKTWEYRLDWLNNILGEVWKNRGRFPGIGSVLEYLGFRRGILFHRSLSEQREDLNLFEYVFQILVGKEKPITQFKKEFSIASEKWNAIPEARRELLKLLSHFELSPSQIKRVCDPRCRKEALIEATEEEIINNPYVIAELDDGESESPRIDFETIDRGMIPAEEISNMKGATENIARDDKRRIRAVLIDAFKEAADSGDTCLPLEEVLKRIRNRLPEKRMCDPDQDIFLYYKDFYSERTSFLPEDNPIIVSLNTLRKMEVEVKDRILKMIEREYDSPDSKYWKNILDIELKSVKVFDKNTEETAREEKIAALKRIFSNRFSILTGRAGTGKTTVIKALLSALEEKEGKNPVLLLAPTGKARVRLHEITKKESLTIHQFLMKYGWIRGETFSLLEKGDDKFGAATVIIDESSMIPMDLFATLFRAIDFNEVKRFILVGDPNQLPPIGPGRPFVDIIKYLEGSSEKKEHIAYLSQRVRHEELESQALMLADAFLGEKVSPGDDEIISKVAKRDLSGDLEVHYWNDEDELYRILNDSFRENLGFEMSEKTDYKGFNKSIEAPDAWQILSPTRMDFFGTTEINRIIQRKFKIGLIMKAKLTKPRPFGDQQLVWSDKVVQIVNSRKKAWFNNKRSEGYVANGEVGLIKNTSKNNSLDVEFSTQPMVRYRYYGNTDVNENLELAYSITVHKSQGSDFDKVFLVLPQNAKTLSKELLYTGLTRFKKKMVLLIEKDINPLLIFRKPQYSEILRRNTNLFEFAMRPDTVGIHYPEKLIHKTLKGELVRSKSEVVIANILTKNGISYKYEEPLHSKTDTRDFRLPDFTLTYEGKTFYWEHLGMLNVPEYKKDWERKEDWYRKNGYHESLLISLDGPDGSINSKDIEQLIKTRVVS